MAVVSIVRGNQFISVNTNKGDSDELIVYPTKENQPLVWFSFCTTGSPVN